MFLIFFNVEKSLSFLPIPLFTNSQFSYKICQDRQWSIQLHSMSDGRTQVVNSMAEESCSCYHAAMSPDQRVGVQGKPSTHRVEGASFMKMHTEDCMEEAYAGGGGAA